MRMLSIDIETYSSVDLKKAGLYKYVQSPDFEILLFAWAFDDGPVQIVDFTAGEQVPNNVMDALWHPQIIKRAYNATFEYYCLNKIFGHTYYSPVEWLSQWRCTQLAGLYCGFPMGLGNISEAIGLPQDKRKLGTGGALIRTFCIPCKPTKKNGYRTRTLPQHEPERWELFKTYCKGDVEAERAVANKLKNFPVPDSEQRLWEIDVLMNSRGVMLDMDLVRSALYLSEKSTEELTAEAVEITGLENTNSRNQLIKWLSEELDEEISSLKKEDVSDMLKSLDDGKAKRMLELRQEMSKTSVRKYTAMNTAVGNDDRVRGLIQHYGANRTGRYAGRIVQIQNLPKNYLESLEHARDCVKARKMEAVKVIYGNVPDTLSQLIRTAFIPGEGKTFVVADFSAIEARVIAWLAGEDWRLQVFATHGKIYEASASAMFGVPIELIKKDNPEYALRQKGKIAELALGFGGSKGALEKMGALNMGLTEEELPDIVRRWRAANPRIVDLWWSVGNAAIEVVKYGKPVGVAGLILSAAYDREANLSFMIIQLPSGRKLYYPKPSLTLNQWGREAIQYWGVDQETKKWGLIQTYGPKLVENCVQAIARDCLCEKLVAMWNAEFKIVFHVHDEYVTEDKKETAKDTLEEALAIMAQPISWAPGLLLKGDGFLCDFYKKD